MNVNAALTKTFTKRVNYERSMTFRNCDRNYKVDLVLQSLR